jgi:hypothetical protein
MARMAGDGCRSQQKLGCGRRGPSDEVEQRGLGRGWWRGVEG